MRDYKGANSIPRTIEKMERGERAHMGQLANFAPVMLTPWGTPNVMDSMAPRSDEALARAKKKAGCANIKDQVPYSAETEKPVKSQLNPRFSLWLMGFPIEWAYCGEQVTPSSRKSRQKS
jgi:hypothetical protein